MTPEEAYMLQQQLIAQQMQRKQKKKRKRPQTANIQGRYQAPPTKKPKKKKKKVRRQQEQTEEEHIMQLIQQNPELLEQMQQQQMQQDQEQNEDQFDQIPEVAEEESPMKDQQEDEMIEETEGEVEEEEIDPSEGQEQGFDQENEQMLANLTPDQMAFLQQQSQNEMMQNKLQDYNQMYNPLAQSVAAARQQHQGMAEYNLDQVDDGSHEQIMAKRQALEVMLRDYIADNSKEQKQKKKGAVLRKKNKRRDNKVDRIRMTKFQSELRNKQLSKMKKRDSQQVKLCKKIFRLASDLEKNKLIDEKKLAKKVREDRKKTKMVKLKALENKFTNQMDIIHETIQQEKLNRKITKFAQTQVRKRSNQTGIKRVEEGVGNKKKVRDVKLLKRARTRGHEV